MADSFMVKWETTFDRTPPVLCEWRGRDVLLVLPNLSRRFAGTLGLRYRFNIFFIVLCKILMAKALRALGIGESGQNIESKGLAGKILWNKELAIDFESLTRRLADDGLGELSRIPPPCASWNSQ
jgi:hypothetical protein